MTQVITPSFLALRKAELQRQIVAASALQDEEKLSLLAFQWAHRYGSQTLPTFLRTQSCLNLDSGLDSRNLDDWKFVEDLGEKIPRSLNVNAAFDNSSEAKEKPLQSDLEQRNKSVGCDDLEKIKDGFDSDLILEKSDKDKTSLKSTNSIAAPPPPRPVLNNLRRWLPDREGFPKAS